MILRFFLIAVFACGSAFAASQTLEEINADLLKKKQELEPFDQRKVQIDIESLGLDNVDKKEAASTPPKPVEQKAESIISVQELSPLSETENEKMQRALKELADKTKKQQQKKEAKKLIKKEEKPEEEKLPEQPTEAKELKQPSKKYINSEKKKNLKKRLELEKKRKENLHAQALKQKKFEELRRLYLLKRDDDEKIVPRKKDLNPFLREELPALPILNRYRSQENLHIPIVLTIKERIDLLFKSVSDNDVAAFNELYKDIENPNIKNSFGDTILTYSLLLSRYSIIAAVIDKGADVNMQNKLGYTPVGIAIEMFDFKALEMLANNRADLNALDGFGRSYLMQAARVGFLPGVDLLVSRGVDVNLMDNDGFSALAIAYRHKKEVIAQYLLKHGAKTWVEKTYDPTPQTMIQELEGRWKKQ